MLEWIDVNVSTITEMFAKKTFSSKDSGHLKLLPSKNLVVKRRVWVYCFKEDLYLNIHVSQVGTTLEIFSQDMSI